MTHRSLFVLTSLLLGSTLLGSTLSAQPLPPPQAASGPGGRDYPHAAVTSQRYGSGELEYWIFEPAQPAPASAPVATFFHGWLAMEPWPYAGWIEHLVRRGAIVIYPRYQATAATPADAFSKNALAALTHAFVELSQPGHVAPNLDRVASIGHSVGGLIAANYAATAARLGLPVPRVLLSAAPGKSWGWPEWTITPLEDLSTVPAETLVLSIASEWDLVVLDVDAKRIFRETTGVPLENKDYVRVLSDAHGSPALNGDHLAAISPGRIVSPYPHLDRGARAPRRVERDPARPQPEGGSICDALDFYAFWKLGDALMDAAFFGTHREYALGNTPQQRYMGVWSDGVAVRPLQVTDQP